MKPTPFPQLLHAFFHEWLAQQRNVSHHTVLSYRDSWRLFLRFVAAHKTKAVAKLSLTDLTAEEVLAFLATRRTGSKVLDWNPELPIRRAAQLLPLRRRPRTVGRCAVRSGSAYPYQTGTSTGGL